MGTIKIEKFGGQLPAWDDRFIPEDQASFSQNAYLYSGALIGWRQPKLLRALNNSAAKFAYRFPTITSSISGANLGIIGPVAGDTVTVGEVTYKFVAAPANPNDVLLGGTPTQSAEALFLAITQGEFDPTIVGLGTAPNPAVAGQQPVLGFPYALAGTTQTPGANTIVMIPVTPAATMLLSSINGIPAATQGAAKFKGVVYENVNQINTAGTAYTNIPTSLMATGAEVTGCTSGVAVSSALTVPVTLQGGTTYWIGFIMNTAVALQLATLGTLGVSNINTYTSGPPNPFQTTELSGVTTGGSTVGSLQSLYNTLQPCWQIWGAMTRVQNTDAQNVLTGTTLALQAPSFGAAFNLTAVAESTAGARLSWGGATTFTGGTNQSSDTRMIGASTWLEFLDQDTNVLRTPVVGDIFQRYYFASPSQLPGYNTYNRIAAGQPTFLLGVPAPPVAPTLSILGGGNPTQIGFPQSSTAQVFNALQPFFVGSQMTLGYVPANETAQSGNLLVLYPMQSSVQVTLNDIGMVLSAIGANATFEFQGVIFSDVSATSPPGGPSNKPGDLMAIGNLVLQQGLAATPPQTMLSAFPIPPTLLANTQYWIGAILNGGALPSFISNANVDLALANAGTQGYSAYLNGTVSTIGLNQTSALPIDPATGAQEAPAMTANFPNLQLWGDLSAGTSGAAQEEARAYVYTWVTAYGEEGPPSPPLLLDGYDNATWQVGLYPPNALDMGTDRNIVATRIYRTMASVQGGTVYFYVDQVAAPVTTFVDNYTDDVVAANQILPSTNWFPPPSDLLGLTAMPNGMMAGFRSNEVWFCEPFRPHAWPPSYVMTTDFPIVGLGCFGSNLVACTETNPNVFTGVNPSVMSQARLPLPEPCISRGGILSTDRGVYYPSINGLILVNGTNTANNTTQDWISRDKWDKLTPSKFIRATKNVSAYFAFGTTGVTNGIPDTSVAQQGFTIDLSAIAERESFTIYPQVGGHRIGFGQLVAPLGVNVDNVLSDPWSGVTYLLQGGNTYYYDFTDQLPTIQVATWRSKKFQNPHRDNYSAFRVWFDLPPGGPQTPPTNRTTALPTNSANIGLPYAPGMFGIVRIIADGNYITERELRYSTELMRITSAEKYTTWQIEFQGIVSVTNLKMASSVKELGTFTISTGIK
jgi:hypothetical protein